MVALVLTAAALHTAVLSMPVWTHERLNTYVHCANASGPWSAAALAAIKRQQPRFVVQERCTGRFAEPANASAESKMLAAAAQIQAVNSSIEVYMYNPTFPVVDWYSWGSAADAAAEAGESLEIRWPNGSLYDWGGCGDPAMARSKCGGSRVIDFRNQEGRKAWVTAMVKTVSAGKISGVFIDGFRGGVGGGSAFSALNESEDVKWGLGLNESMTELRAALGPGAAIIGNYGTAKVGGINGRMIERGGSGDGAIKALQQYASKFPNQIVEYHAQNADESSSTFDNTLATFLLGSGKGHYYGTGHGWGGPGADACAAWLVDRPEYFKPVGIPTTLAVQTNVTADANHSGTWSREFSSGTKVFLQGVKPGVPAHETKSCIHWADKTQTGTACEDRDFVAGGYAGLGLAGITPNLP
eukprot:COSAG02_NODE_3648_length_6426_cov_6.186054_4_plen_413_part_00